MAKYKKIKIKKILSNGKLQVNTADDLSNYRFGKLIALNIIGSDDGAIWECLCDCGERHNVKAKSLVAGTTKSCGCLQRETVTTHGMTNTPEFLAWESMRSRCYDKKDPAYKHYHKRVITVCSGWRNSFQTFFNDLGSKPHKNLSLDRINNDFGYNCGHCLECKESGFRLNCRWATAKTQARNRSDNRIIEINGIKKCRVEWAEIYNISQSRIYRREKAGMNIIEAITSPIRKYHRHEHSH